MEFRNQDGEIERPLSSSSFSPSLVYNPPLIRGSAFTKPILPPSSSLVSPRGGGGGGGSGGSARNGSAFGSSTTSSPPAEAEPNPASATVDNSHSNAKNPDPAPISNLSQGAAGASLLNSKASIEAKTTITKADVSVKYGECLRNHAAATGGHVVDGCGEFMPSGDPSKPEALKCAACGCHRSFHRRDCDADANATNSYHHHHGAAARLPLLLPHPHPQSHHHHQHPPQKQFSFGFPSSPPSRVVPLSSGFMAFGGNTCGSGGATTESSSEERINAGMPTPGTALRKRFRTKFTAEQKKKMLDFAERVGWRMQKQEGTLVEQFCAEVGVRRQVLKVWMHNNKQANRKQQQQSPVKDRLLVQQHQQQQ